MELDRIDKRILGELSANARQSNARTARNLKTSKELVNYRIKRLEGKGIIKGYHTIIDYKQLGYNSYRVLLKLVSLDPRIEDDFLRYLKNLKTVNFLVEIAEEYDLAVIFNERSQEAFMENYNNFLFRFSKYIQSKEINIINNIKQFQIPYLENKELFSFHEQKSIPDIDGEDKEILKKISKDARFSYADIARDSGKNSSSIVHKIRSLENKKIIKGYSIDIDWKKLGYIHYKVFLYFSEIDRKTKNSLLSYLSSINELIYITEVIGNQDLEFELLCKNQLELIQKVNDIKNRFPGIIKKTISLITLETCEINYFPLS